MLFFSSSYFSFSFSYVPSLWNILHNSHQKEKESQSPLKLRPDRQDEFKEKDQLHTVLIKMSLFFLQVCYYLKKV